MPENQKETPGWDGKLVMQKSRGAMSKAIGCVCVHELKSPIPLVSDIVLPKSQKRKKHTLAQELINEKIWINVKLRPDCVLEIKATGHTAWCVLGL